MDPNLEIFGRCKFIEGMTRAAEIVRKHNTETSDPRVIYYILQEISKELKELNEDISC